MEMNQDNASRIFQQFFDARLAPLGFTLRTPEFAERVLKGIRQGVHWKLSHHGPYSSFGCHVLYSFMHEFDDAPPNVALGEYRFLSGGQTPFIEVMDGPLKDSQVNQRLIEVLDKDVPVLTNLCSVEQILSEIKLQPDLAHQLIGGDNVIAPFNRAFCLETAGRTTEALESYHALAVALEANPSELAVRCREVAIKRANALGSETARGAHRERPELKPSAQNALVGQQDEDFTTSLARRIVPLLVRRPAFVSASYIIAAIDQLYISDRKFWRNIVIDNFCTALKEFAPEYMAEVEKLRKPKGVETIYEDVSAEIYDRQCAELFAEIISTWAGKHQPANTEEMYHALCRVLRSIGAEDSLEYLEYQGIENLDSILEMLGKMRPDAYKMLTCQ